MDPEEVIQTAEAVPPTGADPTPDGDAGPSRDAVLDALRNNIVDLGLVYEVEIKDGEVDITYSLTTMGCPIGPMIEEQMQGFLAGVPGVKEVRAEMVLRPPWSPDMMSEEAKAELGVF